jgi:hypothetical protein
MRGAKGGLQKSLSNRFREVDGECGKVMESDEVVRWRCGYSCWTGEMKRKGGSSAEVVLSGFGVGDR